MATYSAVTAGEKDADSPLTVTVVDKLDQNPHAMFEGATGAPKIQTAALEQTAASEAVTQATIRDAAVGQAQLKTTTASQTISVGAGSSSLITPTGGTYTMNAFHGASNITNGNSLRECAHGSTYAAELRVYNTSAGSITWYVYSRYVQASPPYNLGNGDISLFIMAKVNKTTKEILATEIAPDPHWAYHGPHDLHPYYGKIQKAAGLWGMNVPAIITGIDKTITRDDLLLKIADMKTICTDQDRLCNALSYQFTMEEKNIDMNVTPHGMGECGPDEAIVFLDPVGAITDQLAILHETMGDFEGGSVSELLESGMIQIGDPLDAVTPSGVVAVSASWKNAI